MSNFELFHNIFAFWAIWIRSRGKVAQRSPFAHFLEMKYFIRFWVLAVLIIVKKKLRWLQNLNIKSIHVCMSAVYPLRNDHYVILSRAIKYFSLFEILSGCNWIIFCGEVMLHYFLLHYFFAASFFAASSSALYFWNWICWRVFRLPQNRFTSSSFIFISAPETNARPWSLAWEQYYVINYVITVT